MMNKPFRIPYMGSKNKIVSELFSVMKQFKPDAKYFYDLFGGGGAMSFMALQLGYKVVYNDFDSDVSNFVKYIQERVASGERSKFGLFPEEWYSFVTREQFKEQIKLHTPYSQFVRVCYSFGNRGLTYLFNPETEKIKHLAHDLTVYRCENTLKEFNELLNTNITLSDETDYQDRRLDFYRQIKLSQRLDLERLQQLEQLQQLQRLQQLERLQQLQQLQQLEVLNKSYNEIDIPHNDKEVIIYCDPPYDNNNIKTYYKQSFDPESFHKWVKEHDKTIFVSEYNVDGLYEVFSKEVVCSMSQKNTNKVTEKLYCNKQLKRSFNLQNFLKPKI